MIDAEEVVWIAVTVTIDDLSVETRTEAEPVPIMATVAALSTTENAGSRQPALIVGKTLYLLGVAAEPTEKDRFIVRGKNYEVEGESHRWGDSGVQVNVVRAELPPVPSP